MKIVESTTITSGQGIVKRKWNMEFVLVLIKGKNSIENLNKNKDTRYIKWLSWKSCSKPAKKS